MALKGLRKGVDEIMKASGGGSRWTSFITWKDQDVKDVVFLTPAEEIATVRLHNFVQIPYMGKDEKGNDKLMTRYGTFLCRKDPCMRDESGNTCPLCDDIGHTAAEKGIAVALELKAIRDGRKVTGLEVAERTFKTQDGTEKTVPVWGLVIQAKKNFFRPLIAQEQLSGESITDTAFSIGRTGSDQSTSYAFLPLKPALPKNLAALSAEVPTLEEILEEMGSEEKYATELADVKPGSQKNKYNTGGTGGSPSSSPAASSEGFDPGEFAKLAEELGATSGDVDAY